METNQPKFNRCNGYTKTGKKCRTLIKEIGKFYCCKNHEPINVEILSSGCFICCENIENTRELIYFKCKHVVHRTCYDSWLEYSNYDNPICIICRKEINICNTLEDTKKNKKKVIVKKDYINNIDFINDCISNNNNAHLDFIMY